ncbi:MAG: hypothetical protein ACN6PW_02280, partial [Pseudomonas kermanshahensis]|uniref:hypothetical protein n=1 Tax=Pseudomonas kermanshahensis TaxID=2745482 RepID=UPI003D102185
MLRSAARAALDLKGATRLKLNTPPKKNAQKKPQSAAFSQHKKTKAPDLTIKAPSKNMGWTMGIEPTTTGITIRRS